MLKSSSLLVITIAFLLGACASNTTNEKAIANAQENSSTANIISIYKYKYIPEVLKIKVGETVRWVNNEKRQYHSVWFEENGEDESVYLFPEETLDKKFDTPGVYNYRCGPHPEMIAKIIVK